MAQIKKSTLDFLNELKYNNIRDWFQGNQPAYKEAKKNFESFVQELINEIISFDPELKGLEVKDSVFRINRDIRFSNDKSPYKTNFGAFMVKGGKKNGDKYAGYYFHLEPQGSMIAGGAYVPPSPWLSAIREKISEEPEEFLGIINEKEFKKYFGNVEGEKLKTAPKGYPSDHPQIEYLKLKSYLAMAEISDDKVIAPDYLEYVIKVFRAMKPLNDFLNRF
jgi:uncharacterized protein (TIGR02453 family)